MFQQLQLQKRTATVGIHLQELAAAVAIKLQLQKHTAMVALQLEQ